MSNETPQAGSVRRPGSAECSAVQLGGQKCRAVAGFRIVDDLEDEALVCPHHAALAIRNGWKVRRMPPNATSSAMDCRPPNPPAAGLAWVLVPRIPTLAMMEAGWGICGGPGYAAIQTNPDKVLNALARFERVVAAAPNAPRSATPGGGQ